MGLAGQAGCGKDTVADHLVAKYGFVRFAFSDALYHEVQMAFGLENQDLLRDRVTKEEPSEQLRLGLCNDADFVGVGRTMISAENPDTFFVLDNVPLSPRQVLQWWGTDLRRAQNPDYWVFQAAEFVHGMFHLPPYPELRPHLFVNTTVRFENERQWIHSVHGNVWHIHRDGIAAVNAHVSEEPLEVWEIEREVWNNDTIERLGAGIDAMFSGAHKFVKVEPLLPVEENS